MFSGFCGERGTIQNFISTVFTGPSPVFKENKAPNLSPNFIISRTEKVINNFHPYLNVKV